MQNQHTSKLISARKTSHKQHQKPDWPTVTLTWHASQYKVHVCINSTRGTSSLCDSMCVQNQTHSRLTLILTLGKEAPLGSRSSFPLSLPPSLPLSLSHTHTHTHTHTHSHSVHTHTHTHIHARARTRAAYLDVSDAETVAMCADDVAGPGVHLSVHSTTKHQRTVLTAQPQSESTQALVYLYCIITPAL